MLEMQQGEGEDVALNTKGELYFLVGILVMKDVSSGGDLAKSLWNPSVIFLTVARKLTTSSKYKALKM